MVVAILLNQRRLNCSCDFFMAENYLRAATRLDVREALH